MKKFIVTSRVKMGGKRRKRPNIPRTNQKAAKHFGPEVNKLINIILLLRDDTRLVRVVTNIIGLKEDKLAEFRF